MNIDIKSSNIQFKNPRVGQPTRAIGAHYNGRRIMAIVDGREELFTFTGEELPFDITIEDMVVAIEEVIQARADAE